MRYLFKPIPYLAIIIATFSFTATFAQTNKKKENQRREKERKQMHSRDSLLRSLNKSDTSINSLLQRVEQYSTIFNQIKNSLAQGLDTAEIMQQLPSTLRRIDKIDTLTNTHKSSSLRYLFVLSDNIDHIQDKLDGWQSELNEISTKLASSQSDLMKFTKDSLMKAAPGDSALRKTFFTQRKALWLVWHKSDSINRSDLLKISLLADKIAVAYTKTLDESDHIDSKIKNFATKAFAGESSYIWKPDPQYNGFNVALNGTIKLNQLLFDYFIKNQLVTHLFALAFLVLVLAWIMLTRRKVLKTSANVQQTFEHARYIYNWPLLSSLLVVITITPYFYSNFPEVFWEFFFLIAIVLTLILAKRDLPAMLYKFLRLMFVLALVYSVSNLFIELNNADRYIIFVLSIISIISGYIYYKKARAQPEGQLPYTDIILKIFIGLQVISLLLNISGRFSLAKIIGVTSVFNLWLLIIFYNVVRIIIEALYLQFEARKDGKSIINWIDFNLVQKKFRNTLLLAAGAVWFFVLLQNLNIDDWAGDTTTDILNHPYVIGGKDGASFTLGGFVIFIAVIWLSTIASRIISYLFDVSAQRVNDLSALKKKNRTSTLIIRMGVFSLGFLLAVMASGFPLDKLTIIISAFGVGIGFGLQNIVNNLVSGLILAFEKPIQIGDIVEIGGASGTMTAIGIRSSKILTGDGSEVIIPNGDLISQHVTNWTLSNSNRQVTLVLNTAYGVDIEKVKTLLKELLTRRNDIMDNPSPSVFVNNMSEAAIEFKVFFWVADINTTLSLKSSVLTDIYREFREQEIALPSAQKDYYLHFPDGQPVFNQEPAEEPVKKEKKSK